jgi:3-hydroxyacyl-CoA dehydrogenase
MWYGDTVGLDKVLAKIRALEKQHGAIWTPSALLVKLVEQGKKFADFDRDKGVSA